MKKSMCFMVWRDMLMQIRNYKWFRRNEENTIATWRIIYWSLVFPIWCGDWKGGRMMIEFGIFLIIFGTAMLLISVCPASLPKMMYLCPMEAQERKKYLVTAYLIKVLFTIVVCSIVEMTMLGLGAISWYGAAVSVFSVAMMAIGGNMPEAVRAYQPADERNGVLQAKCRGYLKWLTAQQVYSMVYLIFVFSGIAATADISSAIEMGVVIAMSVANLLLTLWVLSYFKRALEVMMDYEMMYENNSAGGTKR